MNRLTVDLGWCMARITIDRVEIVSPSDSDQVHAPASSVVVYGQDNVRKLSEALAKVLPQEGA